MSYDIWLEHPVNGKKLTADTPHDMRGGTYAVGGTKELWINITYNYSQFFYKVFGDGGIRQLYGKPASEAIPIIKKAISQLKDDTDQDYWKATEGNAKAALHKLLALCQMRPDGIIEGD